jgi:adenosylcobinamide-phosphate synthase
MISTIGAFLIDLIIGDPRSRLHPVALMGALISWLEKKFYRSKASHISQFFGGFLVVAIVLLLVYDVTMGILLALDYVPNGYVVIGIKAILLSFLICPHSLAKAGNAIYKYLRHGHIHIARTELGWIVGRDTDTLSQPEIVRATVETVAENTTDGIVSPLFFFAIGGLPLAALYKAANTLDSMIAYKNDKYLYFGRTAARVDDILNFIPARITALLFILASVICRYDARHAFSMMWRDASKHPSPNGGYAEATVAGALGIRLGGHNTYFGKDTFRAYMGDPVHPLRPNHIRASIYLMYVVTILAVVVTASCRWLLAGLWS